MNVAAAVLALCFVAVAQAAGGANVVTLTTANFESVINGNEFVLVEFYAPWCGHCKSLAPEYEKAAAVLKKDGIVLGAVDATIEKELGNQFGVRGYPTLKFFKNGKPEEYKGGRTESTIVSWIRKATGPSAKAVSGDGVKAFADDNKVAVVGFFGENSPEFKAFSSVADSDDANAYAYSLSEADATAAGASFPGVALFKKFDEGKNIMSGPVTVATVREFVQTNSIPTVIDFDMAVVSSVFQSKIGKVAFLFSETPNADFNALATEYKGKLVFVRATSKEPRLNQHIGIEPKDFPKLFILETEGNMVKYPAEGGVSKAEMKNHIDRYLNGQAVPHFKSEEVPANNDGPVKIVVGKNFDDIVMDENKDVLLEVYAPWCGHCKKLEPIWNDLGEHYKSNPNIVIAKMDGTLNERKGLDVKGFPTLKFYPAGKNKRAVPYEGGREFDDIKAFLDRSAKSRAAEHEEL